LHFSQKVLVVFTQMHFSLAMGFLFFGDWDAPVAAAAGRKLRLVALGF